MRCLECGAIVCASIGSWSGHAVTVQYTATRVGGATWRDDYTVENDTLVEPAVVGGASSRAVRAAPRSLPRLSPEQGTRSAPLRH
jgi:hypothetical protein